MEPITTGMVRAQLQEVLHGLEAMTPGTASKPLKALADPAQMLTRVRNAVIAARRADRPVGSPDLLPRLNQLASVMASLEYPLGGVHWPRIEALRTELGALIAAMGGAEPAAASGVAN
jgi:hypothetical protein